MCCLGIDISFYIIMNAHQMVKRTTSARHFSTSHKYRESRSTHRFHRWSINFFCNNALRCDKTTQRAWHNRHVFIDDCAGCYKKLAQLHNTVETLSEGRTYTRCDTFKLDALHWPTITITLFDLIHMLAVVENCSGSDWWCRQYWQKAEIYEVITHTHTT